MEPPIFIFDGVCNFCNGLVNFLIDRDPKKRLRFAAAQGKTGKKLLKKFKMKYTSIIFIDDGKVYTKSTAFLRMMRYLSGPWPVFYVFILLPKFLRNILYDLIGKNRYKWFGKRTTCRVPTKNIKDRFLL